MFTERRSVPAWPHSFTRLEVLKCYGTVVDIVGETSDHMIRGYQEAEQWKI